MTPAASGLYAGGLLWRGIASLAAWLAGAPRMVSWWCWGSTGLLLVVAGLPLRRVSEVAAGR